MTETNFSAQKEVSKTEGGNALSRFAVFKRHNQLFGLTIDLVREVLPGQPLTRVAGSMEEILGVLSLRGEILPVVVIDSWLGLPVSPDTPTLPILVLRRAELLVGLRVDAIQSVVTIPAREVQPHPSAESGALLKGIWHPEGHAPITLIDGTALIQALCRQTSANS